MKTSQPNVQDILPHASEAERCVLGSLLLRPECAPSVLRAIRSSDLMDEANRVLFQAIVKAQNDSRPIDPRLLVDDLRGNRVFGEEGPALFLAEIASAVPTAAHAEFYAQQVADVGTKRSINLAARHAIEETVNGNANGKANGKIPANEILANLGSALHDISHRASDPLSPMPIKALTERHDRLKDPIIDGLLRKQEVANVVAPSKLGKSWGVYGLSLSVATGTPWLGRFDTRSGRVLIIDNELHPETIAHRIPQVAEALSIRPREYQGRLDVLSLRGRLTSIHGLADLVQKIAGLYQIIIVDAYYRMLPRGVSENDNADIMAIYNTVDSYAETTGAAWIFIHHTSKGLQGEKAVTDVGAGAGAQSRAADTHLVLRPHENEGCVVLEAALRSWPPVEPLPLRWEFPIWVPDPSMDPNRLRGCDGAATEKQRQMDMDGFNAIRNAIQDGRTTPKQIRVETGFSYDRLNRLLSIMRRDEAVSRRTVTIRGQETHEYTVLV